MFHTEFLTFIALIIGGSNQLEHSSKLWKPDADPTLSHHADYSQFMNQHCFWEIKQYIPLMMESTDKSANEKDDWWRVRAFIDGFNQ